MLAEVFQRSFCNQVRDFSAPQMTLGGSVANALATTWRPKSAAASMLVAMPGLSRNLPLLPAGKPAQYAEAAGEERERGWDGDGVHHDFRKTSALGWVSGHASALISLSPEGHILTCGAALP
jgi:hypothetical protein